MKDKVVELVLEGIIKIQDLQLSEERQKGRPVSKL